MKMRVLAAMGMAAGVVIMALAACGQGTETEKDRADIIRLSLQWALVDKKISDYALLEDPQNVVISSENIDGTLLPIPGVNLILLDPQAIQKKANQEGDFLYLVFKQVEVNGSSAEVSLENTWAVGKDTRRGYLSGGGARIAFDKKSGGWVLREILSFWIS